MSPAEGQHGSESEYPSKYHRQVDLWSVEMQLSIRFHRESDARAALGAANKLDAPDEVIEHYVNEIQRLKE